MNNNKIKSLSIILSYSFFIVIIVICLNAVVPEDDLILLEQHDNLIEKVENSFSRNTNSVYEILEKKTKKLEKEKPEQKPSKIDEKLSDEKIIDDKLDEDFKVQFASFKDKEKSLEQSKILKNNLQSFSEEIDLIIKKVAIKNDKTFFRIVTKNYYSFDKAKDTCTKLKKINVKCIVIKNKK